MYTFVSLAIADVVKFLPFLFRLVLAARSEEKLKETQRLCLQYSPHVEVVVADVSQEHKCKEIVDRAVHSFGAIDMLILNAAFSPTPSWFTDIEEPVREGG